MAPFPPISFQKLLLLVDPSAIPTLALSVVSAVSETLTQSAQLYIDTDSDRHSSYLVLVEVDAPTDPPAIPSASAACVRVLSYTLRQTMTLNLCESAQ